MFWIGEAVVGSVVSFLSKMFGFGGTTCHLAARSADAISDEKEKASMSPVRKEQSASWPAKADILRITECRCSLVNVRHATFSSNWIRSNLSCSAVRFASAAL